MASKLAALYGKRGLILAVVAVVAAVAGVVHPFTYWDGPIG